MSGGRNDIGRPVLIAVALAATLATGRPAIAEDAPIVHAGESPPAAEWRKAVEAGDLAALARMHDSASVAFPPDKLEVKGATAILADYSALFAKYEVHVTVEDAHWVAEGPIVVSWGLTTLVLHPKAGGTDVVSRTRFTDLATKTSDGWRYIVDHASKPVAD